MRIRLFLILGMAALPVMSQKQPPVQSDHRMEITVERLQKGVWKVVDPGHVFEQNDRVRFRYRANFAGYLYVINRNTSGSYEQLFPRKETGEENNIVAAKDYTIPSTSAIFRIAGPAGHELIYWLASPVQLAKTDSLLAPGASLPPESKPPSGDLIPRCDDAIFRARGDCVDSSAGPQGISEGEPLPRGLATAGAATPRDLMFLRRDKATVVASPAPLTGPIIYEFRLAHK